MAQETATITAEDQFTDWIRPSELKQIGVPSGYLNFSITGNTTSIEISVQRTVDDGTTVIDLPTTDATTYVYTANYAGYIEDHEEAAKYRLGCKTGGFTSGTCNLRLGI